MRDLRANQKTIWYQDSNGSAAIKDENGDRTGEERPVMEPPEQLRISVSGAAGAMEAAAFGGFTDYSRTACTANVNCYFYEPSVLYAFSMFSFYGKGTRLAVNLKYTYHRWLTIQAKWGWTHYMDRNRISSGTEEIMGSNKADLQFQVRVKW